MTDILVRRALAYSPRRCDDEGVGFMNDAQIWTMIGSFVALMFSTLTVVSTLFVRVVRSEIGGLRNEMNGQIGGLRNEMNGQIGGLRNEMNGQIGGLRNEMNARFDAVNTRIDGLDRDVQAIVKRTFGLDRD
ncbi:hypothetical protein AB3M89_08950 [Microbacterium sp. 179-I 3D2 NHS]|uniref:hypothetical protein n=1 Tax=Microbacterium sp. 179-I 3D2 NHS TaxID=3235178 RepID=UPI0039A15DC5